MATIKPHAWIQERITESVRAAAPDGLSLTDISGLFSHNVQAHALRAALHDLETRGDVMCERINTPTRPRTVYYLAAESEEPTHGAPSRRTLLTRIQVRAWADIRVYQDAMDARTLDDAAATMTRAHLLACLHLIEHTEDLIDRLAE